MDLNCNLADIGLIGLAVMGENLVLNINDHGYKVCVFNRTISKIDDFLNTRAKTYTLDEFVNKLKKPRIIILLVMAGKPVDDFIDKLLPLLEKEDIIIDAGNSDYQDTQRRFTSLTHKEIRYVGCGVSGGEMGARYGPSIMPGGSESAWKHIKPILESISAKVGDDCCVTWVGPDGAGHYVKMIHNGIEYGDMQLICEAYHIMKAFCGFSNDKMSQIFSEWNNGELESYLIEITANILNYKEDGKFLVDRILDSAGQKGTGKWTVINSLELGIPVTLIGEAVFSRCLSALKSERVECSQFYSVPQKSIKIESNTFVEDIRAALYASKIVSYAQGFMLLRDASNKFNWNLDFGKIAMIWRGGCIIKSRFLRNIYEAFKNNPDIKSLLVDTFFISQITRYQESWRRVVSTCILHGLPVPAFSSALSFFDGYRSEHLPANLLQAQRDYFGAHTYEIISEPGKKHHSEWGQK